MDVESENFEEIKLRTKLNVVDNANLSVIIWDFLHEIIIKHFIDDLSQYPFWMAKVSITTGPQVFGMSAVQNCLDFLRNTFRTKGALGLYEVCSLVLSFVASNGCPGSGALSVGFSDPKL